jgi:hypothetical protein
VELLLMDRETAALLRAGRLNLGERLRANSRAARTSSAQDCEEPDGSSSSRPNIFGGFDTEGPGKARWSSQPNLFQGQDIRTRSGTIQSQPNIFGGETYRLPDGGRVESVPNIFGGRDYRYPDGRTVTCSPNIFGGQDCR